MKLIFLLLAFMFTTENSSTVLPENNKLVEARKYIDSNITAEKFEYRGGGHFYEEIAEYSDSTGKLTAVTIHAGAENSVWGTFYFDDDKIFAIDLHRVKHVLTYDSIKDDVTGEYVKEIEETYYLNGNKVVKQDNLTKMTRLLDKPLDFREDKYSFMVMCYLSATLCSKIKDALPQKILLKTNDWFKNIIISKNLDMKIKSSEKSRIIIRSHNLNNRENFIRHSDYRIDTLDLTKNLEGIFKLKGKYAYYDLKVENFSSKDSVSINMNWIPDR